MMRCFAVCFRLWHSSLDSLVVYHRLERNVSRQLLFRFRSELNHPACAVYSAYLVTYNPEQAEVNKSINGSTYKCATPFTF